MTTTSTKKRRDAPIKVKGRPPKIAKIGNWKESTVLDKKIKPPEHMPIISPHVRPIEALIAETFPMGRPMDDSPDIHACKHCKKAVLGPALIPHIARCLQIKKEKAQRKKVAREARERLREAQREEEMRKAGLLIEDDGKGDDSDGGGAGSKAGSGVAGKTSKKAGKKLDSDSTAKGKKRKADGDPGGKEPKNKKKKEEPKPKVPKPKGPVDVERQCGVLLANGQPCARSLTCKSHPMGAKRAVAGRSMPYDMLLQAYQKKNQAKQQKAALDANAPLEDDEDAANGPIDEEEEAQLVMMALKNWRPQPPVPQRTFAPLKFEAKHARLRELLDSATNGGRTNIFKVSGYGAQKLPDGHPGLFTNAGMNLGLLGPAEDDAPGEPDVMIGGGPVGGPPGAAGASRRASVVSRA